MALTEKMDLNSLKIEMNLDIPLTKTKCKANLFTIFNDLEINDEKDIYSLSYAINKENGYVYKLIISFKSVPTGELFFEYISNNLDKYKFSNLIKNQLDSVESSYSLISGSVSSSDSICVLDSGLIHYLDNQVLSIETSYMEKGIMDRSLFMNIERGNKNDMIESSYSNKETISTSSSELTFSENNAEIEQVSTTIELHSSTQINKEDLDVIIMFLENAKRSGGGDVCEYKLNDKQRILIVKFENKLVRDRILCKKTLKFKNYSFNLRTPYDKKECDLDKKTLILRNFKLKGDLEIVEMFAENLVCSDNEENEVIEIIHSKVFSINTFYIKFKQEFDYEKVEKRLARKPTLFDRRINLIQAYVTNTVVIRMADRNEKINAELIDLHFTNKKRSGISSYEYLTDKDPFIILSLDSEESIKKCLGVKHEISKKELLVEYLHNFDLVDEELNSNLESNSKVDKELKIEKEATQIVQLTPIEIEKFQLPKIPPSFLFELSTEPNASILNYWNEDQLKRLTNELFEIDAVVGKISEQRNIKIDCMIQFEQHVIKTLDDFNRRVSNWERKAKQHLKNFFSEFDTQKIRIKVPTKCIEKLKYDKLRVHLEKLDNEEFNSEYEITGFKDQVKILVSLLNTENELQDKMDKEIISDEIGGLKLHQSRILFVKKFIKTMKDKYEEIQININAKTGIVKIYGSRTQIEDAKKHATAILNSVISRIVPKRPIYLKLISKREKAIANWLKEKPIQCVLEADTSKNILIIHSTEASSIEKFLSEAKIEIVEKEFDLSIIDNKSMLRDMLNRLEDDEKVVVNEDFEKSYLNICGFKENVDHVYDDLCKLT